MKKNSMELVFILDKSGSMHGLEADTIGGFNSVIDEQKKLEGELRSVIGLGFKVRLVEPKGIERSEGKARRVIDKRQL